MKKSIAIIAAIAVFCAMVFYYFYDKKLQEDSFGPSLDGMKKEERLALKKNIIVLGVDERPEEYDPGRSDTLFVVMLDTNNKNVSLLSVPRDTRVHIPKFGWDKINHAYPLGGRELTQRTVEEFLGIKINNYVAVDFKGFKGLVDAIGGVDIDVEEDMYYKDSWDGFTVDIKKGRQHLDGEKAIQYVRYRDWDGDIGRVKRQQRFIMSMYEKIASEELLKHIPGLAKQLTSMIRTDLNIAEMISLGKSMHTMVKESGVKMNTVPGEGKYIDRVSYYVPDIKETRKLMAEMQGAEMTERYKNATAQMVAEYERELSTKDVKMTLEEYDKDKKAEAKDSKDKNTKITAEQRLQKLKERQAARKNKAASEAVKKETTKQAEPKLPNKKSVAKTEAVLQSKPVRDGVVVRLVNCSGKPANAAAAIARLRSVGFRVVSGGSGSPIAETLVISTTNNGSIVSKLSGVPFVHKLSINRDGAADCDGVIMLGQDFQ